MSNMLDQAIIDAEALKEAAIKNAEATIVEKYSKDIKKAVNQLLEQEGAAPPPSDAELMAAMGGMAAPPGTLEAPGGMDAGADILPGVPETYMEGTPREVRIDLAELVQEMKMDDLSPSEKQVHELVAEEVTGGEEIEMEGGEEAFTIQESVFASILGEDLDEDVYEEGEEPLHEEIPEVDISDTSEWSPTTGETTNPGAVGGGTTPSPVIGGKTLGADLSQARKVGLGSFERGGTEFAVQNPQQRAAMQTRKKAAGIKEQLRAYQHNYAKLYESHQAQEQHHAHLQEHYAQLQQQAAQTSKQNKRFKELLVKTQEKLSEINVRNAQLHYTNRTLVSDSLNERQKDRIVEAIQKAGTVGEAKVIFETLQSAVAGAGSKQNAPKSLNEAISNRSSAFLPRKREDETDSTMLNRLQKLAGIK